MAESVFVGDFIGNRELINLIKYGRETIMFHSVMSKSRSAGQERATLFCEPNSFEILSRHAPALDIVVNRPCGTFSSYSDLCAALAELHKQVTNSTL